MLINLIMFIQILLNIEDKVKRNKYRFKVLLENFHTGIFVKSTFSKIVIIMKILNASDFNTYLNCSTK